MLKKGHDPHSRGQVETPVESTLVNVETTGNRVRCPQMGIELDLPFFRNIILFSELLILRFAHPLAGNGRGRMVFPLNKLCAGRIKPSKFSNSYRRELKEGSKKIQEEKGLHVNTTIG